MGSPLDYLNIAGPTTPEEDKRFDYLGVKGEPFRAVQPRRSVTENMDPFQRAALDITQDLGFFDKLLIGAGQRSVQVLTSLPLLGDAFADMLGVHDEVESLPGLGAAGLVGSLIPDLLLFRGLGGVGRAAGARAAGAGAGRIGQLAAREAGVGAAYGALTHGENRVKGAAIDAAIFSGLGVSLGGVGRLGTGMAVRLKQLRTREDVIANTGRAIIDNVDPALSRVESIAMARASNPLKKLAEKMGVPIPGRIAARASRGITDDLTATVPKELRAKIYKLKGRLEKIGFDGEEIGNVFEAVTTTRTVKEMLVEQADELILELRSMVSMSRMLSRGGMANEAVDALYIQYAKNTLLADGLNIGMVDTWFMPFLEEMNLIQSRTGVPALKVAKAVSDAKNLMMIGETEFPKRLAMMSGDVTLRALERLRPRQVARIARVVSKDIRQLSEQQRSGVMAALQGPDLFGRVTAEGRRLLGEELDVVGREARERATARLAREEVAVGRKGVVKDRAERQAAQAVLDTPRPDPGRLIEGSDLRGMELTRRLIKMGEGSLEGTDAKLWKFVRSTFMEGNPVLDSLPPAQRRYAIVLRDLMEDWRGAINRAQVPAGPEAPLHLVQVKVGNKWIRGSELPEDMLMVHPKTGELVVPDALNPILNLPPKAGYMAKMLDLTDAEVNSAAADGLKIGNAAFTEARNNEMKEFMTDPFRIAQLYNRRALKLITLERPVRDARRFVEELKKVEGTFGTGKRIGMQTSEAMTYWLERVWGIPTRSDEIIGNNIAKLFEALGVSVPRESALGVASIIRDIYYTGLIGLRLPFVAARNITQAPLLAGTELGGGFSWVTRGYARGFKELSGGDALKVMRKHGALPAYAESLDLAVENAERGLPKIAKHISDLRNHSMIIFAGSDRLNRLAAFWGAVEKFEHATRKLATADLKGQAPVDWLIAKSGIGRLRPGERQEFRAMLGELKGNAKDVAKRLEEAKFRFAASVSNRTQFAYSTVGSPLATRSIGGKLVFQFMTWPMYYGSFVRTMVKSPEGKVSMAAHMTMASLVMAQWLKFIEYDPETSMLLGPFTGAFDRTEYGDFALGPGPAVASAINFMGSAITDANSVLHGDFEEFELGKTGVETIESILAGLRDFPRLGRVVRGEQERR